MRVEVGTLDTKQGRAGADSVVPSMEELLASALTSLGGGTHDEGDPRDASGGEEVRAMADVPVGSARVGAKTVAACAGYRGVGSTHGHGACGTCCVIGDGDRP